jgi:hypothetical protein
MLTQLRNLSLAALLFASAAVAQPQRYLDVVTKFVETMMEKGTDRYGPVHSPLFAALLDLNTMSLPVEKWPGELKPKPSGMIISIGFGLPDMPLGVRASDRAPIGNNLNTDMMLLRAMYELSALTGNGKFADHADAYLRFWIKNCQSPETGLMYWGEHASWNFLEERGFGDVHEIDRQFPFYDKLYSIDPYHSLKFADGLWISQIGNKKVADFSRHAAISHYKPDIGWGFTRHAGFYVWAYAHAYAQSRDPKYIERADTLIESRVGKRARDYSLMLDPSFKPETFPDAAFRLLLWDAAALVPAPKQAAWRKIVRELDEEAFAQEKNPKPWPWGTPEPGEAERALRAKARWEKLYPSELKHGRVFPNNGSLQTESTTLSPLWAMGYGSGGGSGKALLNYTRFKQTDDARFLRAAEAVADQYVAEGFPKDPGDLWPKSAGQVISLLLALSHEKDIPAARQKIYFGFARETADKSITLFSKNGLFRADGIAEHYEAITGSDDLLWGLLQLYCELARPDHRLPYNNLNW